MKNKVQYVMLKKDEYGTGLYSPPASYKKIKADALGWKRLVPSEKFYIAIYDATVSSPDQYKIIEVV